MTQITERFRPAPFGKKNPACQRRVRGNPKTEVLHMEAIQTTGALVTRWHNQ